MINTKKITKLTTIQAKQCQRMIDIVAMEFDGLTSRAVSCIEAFFCHSKTHYLSKDLCTTWKRLTKEAPKDIRKFKHLEFLFEVITTYLAFSKTMSKTYTLVYESITSDFKMIGFDKKLLDLAVEAVVRINKHIPCPIQDSMPEELMVYIDSSMLESLQKASHLAYYEEGIL
ncbi:MAG: hypothetical protein JKX79_07345 [Labilibaculum sp.]|nr:hypothetical protein [Labilibaculum sp.]